MMSAATPVTLSDPPRRFAMADTRAAMFRRTLVKRNPAQVRGPCPDPRPKRDPAYIRALAADIGSRGLRNPPYITNREGYDWIIVGEHRRLAMVDLLWSDAEFWLVEDELSPVQLAVEALQEAKMHKGFSLVEQVASYQVMLGAGMSRAEIAELTNSTEVAISRAFKKIKGLCPQLLAEAESAKLGASFACVLADIPDHAQQLALAQQVYSGMKRDTLIVKVKDLLGKRGRRPPPTKVKYGGVSAEIKGDLLPEFKAFLAKGLEAVKRLEREGMAPELLQAFMK